MWVEIKFALIVTNKFDYEVSMIVSLNNSFRQFSAILIQNFQITKDKKSHMIRVIVEGNKRIAKVLRLNSLSIVK